MKLGHFAKKLRNLESIIQSEVSQKEKNKYYILMHLNGVQKNDTDELICRARIEMPTQRIAVWAKEQSGRWGELGGWD